MWIGYLLVELSGAFAGGVSAAQQTAIDKAVKTLNKITEQQPYQLWHYRMNLAKTAFIGCAQWSSKPSKSDLVAVINQFSGISTTVLNSSVAMTIFNGETWDASGDACRAYLAANLAAWESAEA